MSNSVGERTARAQLVTAHTVCGVIGLVFKKLNVIINRNMNTVTGTLLLIVIACTAASAVSLKEHGKIKLFQSPATYSVDSMVLLNDAGRKDKEVGYKVVGSLDVEAVWGVDSDHLLKFVLHSPKLLTKGKLASADYQPVGSGWDSRRRSEFYARWRAGLIVEAYLDPEEVSDVLNFKKSLISLFQLQVIDGEHNETDVSGMCRVLYDTVSMHVVRKTKRQCRAAGPEQAPAAGDELTSRRLTRYTFSDDARWLAEVHAEEMHIGGYQHLDAAIKARAWLRLRREGGPRMASAQHPDLAAALAALPANLKPLPLPMLMSEDLAEDELSLEEALEQAVGGGEREEAGGGGTAAGAAAALRAVRALRTAPAARLAAALRAQPDARALAALCRLAGATGSERVHKAVAREVPLEERDAPPQAMLYLQALALAHAADESVVLEALRLGGEARAAGVREAALLAAAAVAARLPPHAAAATTLRDVLPRLLARCVDEECRAMHMRALGNVARGDTAELLLEQAERGGPAALHALHALRALPVHVIGPAYQRRLSVLVTAAGPLELRAAALDLLLLRSVPLPQPLVVARVARALYEHGPSELRRLFWQRCRQLAAEHVPLADVLAMLAPNVRSWHAQAQPGTSSVMARALGSFGTGEARLESVQLARGGLLRRGAVQLLVRGAPAPLLAVELWTRGLETLAGSGEGDGEQEEDGYVEGMSGGMALSVGGARLPAFQLFSGQAELLGHIWAGTGSTATPVLRALLPLGARAQRVPLMAAGVLLLQSEAALELALDAQAQVSLWSRTARAQLELRVGAAGGVSATLQLAAGTLRASSDFSAEPRLRVSADLDFYDRVSLCMRVATDDYVRRTNSTLQSALGEARRGVRRSRDARTPQPGRTLALGAPNDATCGVLLA